AQREAPAAARRVDRRRGRARAPAPAGRGGHGAWQDGRGPRAAADRQVRPVLQHGRPLPERDARARGRAVRSFRPLETGGRRPLVAVLVTFALVSALSSTLSLRATGRSRHQAAVVQVAARQRTLAERYVGEVLLARSGRDADPATTARLLEESADVLLHG